jgi:hypothetical protein
MSFIAEIQQDEIYETILEKLRKKMSPQFAFKPLSIPEEEQRKPFSPHLFAIDDDNDDDDDDDDDLSMTDETSSSSSSENNDVPPHEDYDTDIEPG